jgi:phosphopantetheinyl transferase (holo-ACP synthase)
MSEMNIVFLGNDIIDWKTAKIQLQKLRPRALEKLFNPSEIEFIQHHEWPVLAYWQLWSAKESAYKAWQREVGAKPVFNPMAFKCQKTDDSGFSVSKGQFRCKVTIKTTSNYIYAALVSKKERLVSKVFQSPLEYQAFINLLKDKNWHPEKDDNAIPYFRHKTLNTTLPVSLTHDKEWHALQLSQYSYDLLFNKHNHIKKQIK